jgi:nicotinamidase/pyrazinamidase
VLVDVQVDFLPGGALPVPNGDAVVPVLNEAIATFSERHLPVIASRDWHPPDHCSFRARGGPWPPHCIAGSPGAQFAPALRLPPDALVVSKAVTPGVDAYSAFGGTDLDTRLRAFGIERLIVGGLATDYCVLNTVLDARRSGYAVVVLVDAVRAVDVHDGDGDRALAQMRAAGAVTTAWKQAA